MRRFPKNLFLKGLSGLALAIVLGALFVGCARSSSTPVTGGQNPGGSGWQNQPGGGLLWTAEQLNNALNSDAPLVVIDARFEESEFNAGHVGGAIWIDWRELANDPPAVFPPSPAVEAFLGQERGLEVTDQIVIYGDGALNRQAPFRLFWMLEYYGCTDVHLVDGGYQAWLAGGYPVDTTPWNPNDIVPKNFVAQENNAILAVASGVQDFIENQVTTNKVVIDARTPWEFSGEATEYFQDRAGRIPYSTNLWWLEGIDLATGMLREPADVSQKLIDAGAGPDRDTIVAATTGVRSTVIYFYCRLLGFPCRVYQGGLYNWSDVDNPPLGMLGLVERDGPFHHKCPIRGDLRPHYASASAVYHDLIYVFGGLTYDPTNPPSTVNRGMWIFEPSIDPLHEGKDTDNWAEITPSVSAPRYGHVAATVPAEDTIYLFGGATDTEVTNSIYRCVIDPFTHAITQITELTGLVLPRKLYGLAGAYNEADGRIYLFGGSSLIPFIGASDKAWVFLPPSLGGPKLNLIADLPSARTQCGAVALNGKIYCIGGETANGAILDEILEFDPQTNTWIAVEPMTIPRLGAGCTVAHGRIYVAGGITDDNGVDVTTGLVESYDPLMPSEGWRQEGEMAVSKSHQVMESVNDTISMLGAYMGSRSLAVNNVNFLNVVEYQPEYKVEKTPIPAPLHAGGTAVLGGRIFLFGGDENGTVTDVVRGYDPINDTFDVMDPIPYGPVRGASAVAVNGKALVFGGAAGYTSGTAKDATYIFDPAKPAGSQWSQVADLPAAVYGAASGYYNDVNRDLGLVGAHLVFAVGGMDINDAASMSCFVYDAADNRWHSSLLGDLPRSRAWAAAGVIGDKIYLAGGAGAQGLPLPDTLFLDLDPASAGFLQWDFLGSIPTQRYGQASCVSGTKFYNIGGFIPDGATRHATDAIEVLDIATGRWSHLPGLTDAMALSFSAVAPNSSGGESLFVLGGYVEFPTPIHFDTTIEMTP